MFCDHASVPLDCRHSKFLERSRRMTPNGLVFPLRAVMPTDGPQVRMGQPKCAEHF